MARFINKSEPVLRSVDEVANIEFLCDKQLLISKKLNAMGEEPNETYSTKLLYFVCGGGHRKVDIAHTKGTWFENTKMSFSQVMLLTHCFSGENSYKLSNVLYFEYLTFSV